MDTFSWKCLLVHQVNRECSRVPVPRCSRCRPTALMILLPFCSHSTDDSILLFYSHSTDDSTPILWIWSYCHSTGDSTPFLLIIHLFYWWLYSILLAFYWWFYSHSTRFLLMILLPFYSDSTDDSTPILLPFYWWFYSHSACILLMIPLPFYSYSTCNPILLPFYSHHSTIIFLALTFSL